MLTTLQHGLELVEALADGPLTARELASRTGLPRQSAYRVAATLVACDWVALDQSTNTYRLTRRLWSLGARSEAGSDLLARWGPIVRELATTGETVHLAVYERGEVIYVDKAEGDNPIRAYTQLGGRAPAHCVATGKVLLAYAALAERERVLAGPLIKPTRRTISDRKRLEQQLAQVVVDGYAVNVGEWRDDVGGVAVPIRSAEGVVAALGFSAPLVRLANRHAELLDRLQRAAGTG